MTVDTRGLFAEGARRVWRYQRVLWWLFVLNALFAMFAVRPGAEQFGDVLDRSLHAQRLSDAFDIFAFIELATKPEIQIGSTNGGALAFSLIFFVLSLFMTGGILEAYRPGRKLSTAEFFHACGAFFWRWVRMTLCLVFILAPLLLLAGVVYDWSGNLSENATQEKLGFWILLAGGLLLALVLMAIRFWFDMAQVRAVAENERAVRKSIANAFRLTRKHFAPLFRIYFGITLLAWVVLALALWIWSVMPSRYFALSVIMLELVVLFWFFARLWQRASETVWYERWQASQYTSAMNSAVVAPSMPLARFALIVSVLLPSFVHLRGLRG